MKRLIAVGLVIAGSACSNGVSGSSTTGSGSSGSGASSGSGTSSSSSSGTASGSSSGSSSGVANPTFAADVQPLLAQYCDTCHVTGAIAPFPLLTYSDTTSQLPGIAASLTAGTMPPWPPDDSCNTYQYDRSMPAGDVATILNWIDAGAPEGDPSITPTSPSQPVGLSRIDLTLSMPEPYTPTIHPDDYHCFLIDWPETTTEYVTGFSITPGDPSIVHHAIAYIAPPGQLASYEAQEQSLPDGGLIPSYPCFGGPGGMGALVGWLGVWTPGTSYGDLPAGTGVEIQAGSKIVLQVHYNTTNGSGTDLSSIQVELASSVEKPAALIPFTNIQWVENPASMTIPAGNQDVDHAYQDDLADDALLGYISSGVLTPGQPFTIYSAGAHMHLRGHQETLTVMPADAGANQCLVQVPDWNFRWQGSYFFQNPMVLNPGDQVSIDCHWNNSQANQPYIDGGQLPTGDIEWGEGTEDEMCLAMFYATQ